MAIEITFFYENAKALLMQSFENDARPIIIIEAQKEDRENILSEIEDKAFKISFADFLSCYVYSIKKQEELLNYSYVIVDDVEKLHGLSATAKILSTFINNMSANNVAVIFMGECAAFEMRDVLHMSGSKINCVIKIEPERNNEE